ncbi:MAG: hypothetical protein KGJ98_00175 [Chloroflexota bacterium]|nr:hypothetical protein [Chloroflexota bacterium]
MSDPQGTWVLLDPTLAPPRSTTLTPRLNTLAGKTIGVIWNGRPPGDVLFNKMFDVLRTKYAIKDVVFRAKPYLGNVAPPEIFDELLKRCDAVVTGVGD